MKWIDILKSKKIPIKEQKHPFLWKTSPIRNGGNSFFKQECIRCNLLNVKSDSSAFDKYIKRSKNKYATSFYNLSGDTLLVIPMPRKNKNFSNLNEFMKNASPLHIKKFWEYVYSEIQKLLPKEKELWVSTHGLGVPYLHLRISTKPKYYGSSKLKNM